MLLLNPLELSFLARVGVICGVNLDDVLREIDPTGYDISEAAPPLPVDTLQRLHDAVQARPTRAHFPFMLGNYYAFDHAPEINTFVSSSASLRELLVLLRELPVLLHPELQAAYEPGPEETRIEVLLVRAGARLSFPSYVEVVACTITRLIEQIIGQPVEFRLAFRHAPLTDPAEYRRQFHCRPAFEAPRDEIRFASRLLDIPLPNRSVTLHAKSRLRLERRLRERRAERGLLRSTELLLVQDPELNLQAAGARLGLGERSLQRGLRLEGVSFSDLQARVRHRLAKSLLQNPALDLDDVASKLGFADRSSFTRAFRKWAGCSPSEFRRRMRL